MTFWLLLLLAGLVIAALVVQGVRGYYASPPPGVTTYSVPTADGWALRVHHRPSSARRYVEPVILAHGFANNHRVMEFLPGMSLGEALAAAGFEVFTLDFRGAGLTEPSAGWEWPVDATVDDYVRLDAPAVLAFAQEKASAERAFWVGHSLGGLTGLARAVEAPEGLAGVVTIGSPTFLEVGARLKWLLRLATFTAFEGRIRFEWAMALVAPLAGWVRLPLVTFSTNLGNISGPGLRALTAATMASVWRGVTKQIDRWVRTSSFSSNDGVDWRAGLRTLKVPLLVVGGTVDGLAPPASTHALAAMAPAETTEAVVIGKSSGAPRDYGHGDLLTGQHSAVEVFPLITAWLAGRATPVPTVLAAAGQPGASARAGSPA